jgi:hypothetical protein
VIFFTLSSWKLLEKKSEPIKKKSAEIYHQFDEKNSAATKIFHQRYSLKGFMAAQIA